MENEINFVECRVDEELKLHSTVRIGGKAKYFFMPKNFYECLKVFEFAKINKLPIYILGNGSNTLCSSYGFNGVVLNTNYLNQMYFENVKLRKINKCNIIKYFKIKKNKVHCNLFDLVNVVNCSIKLNKAMLKKKYLFASCFCGVNLIKFSHLVSNFGFKGLEFACGIPASVGGATFMNAGAFNGQMANSIFRVLVYDYKNNSLYFKYNCKLNNNLYNFCKYLHKSICVQNLKLKKLKLRLNKVKKISFKFKVNKNVLKYKRVKNNKTNNHIKKLKLYDKNSTNCYSFVDKIKDKGAILKNVLVKNCEEKYIADYRKTNITQNEFIVAVDFVFSNDLKSKICERINYNTQRRISTQAVKFSNLGSCFKRQGDIIPAKLIDECGLKGFKVGGAMVSDVHAGFIVNYKNATSDDFLKLLKIVQHIICKKYNIMLQYELKFLGDMDEEK